MRDRPFLLLVLCKESEVYLYAKRSVEEDSLDLNCGLIVRRDRRLFCYGCSSELRSEAVGIRC